MTTEVLTHAYTPRGVCRALFEDRSDEVLLSGPAGTGKSRACLEKIHLLALINPGSRGLIVRKSLSSLGSTALVTYREHVAAEALATGEVEFRSASPQRPAQYQYSNGSVIVVGGMDKASKIMSSEYDYAYAQEATELTVHDWESITTRLRNGKLSFSQLIGDCNPDTPTHWLKQRAEDGQLRMYNCRHEENPRLFDADGQLTPGGQVYIGKLDALTGVRYKRLRQGLWVAAEGQIYEDYSPAVHLRDQFTPPAAWPRHWSIDFGYTNPFVCQMWAQDPDGRLYLYREIYRTGRTVDQHARDILKAVQKADGTWREPKPTRVVADHDAEGRAVLARELGMSIKPANKRVLEGIQAVQKRLRPAGDGKPRLYLCRDAVVDRDPTLVEAGRPASTAEEITGYVWDLGQGKAPKEQPLKVDDHGMDATRYLVADQDLTAKFRIRMAG